MTVLGVIDSSSLMPAGLRSLFMLKFFVSSGERFGENCFIVSFRSASAKAEGLMVAFESHQCVRSLRTASEHLQSPSLAPVAGYGFFSIGDALFSLKPFPCSIRSLLLRDEGLGGR